MPSKIISKPLLSNDVFDLPDLRGPEENLETDCVEDDVPSTHREYESRYVAFIDILGFKELIKQHKQTHQNGPASLNAIYDALSLDYRGFVEDYIRVKKQCNGNDADQADLKMNTFSDFVVVSSSPCSIGLEMLLFVVARVSQDWLSKGYLSRGGITKGSVVHVGSNESRPLVFGPAFVEAYLLEQEVADYPRIILSRSLRKDIEHYKRDADDLTKDFYKLANKCKDGPMCIDLFAHLRRDGFSFLGDDHSTEAGQFHNTLKSELDNSSDKPKWHRKTAWLVDQFNSAIHKTKYADKSIDIHE